jgi:hypothetical protein
MTIEEELKAVKEEIRKLKLENLIRKQGENGEIFAKKFFKDKLYGKNWCPDFITTVKGVTFIVEVKNKPFYTSPPFDGHGLEIKEIEDRMNFFNITKIRTILFIIEYREGYPTEQSKIWYQYLDVLEKTKYYDTKISPIRVYNLKYFFETSWEDYYEFLPIP